MSSADESLPAPYTVRVLPRPRLEIEALAARLDLLEGPAAGSAWREGFYRALPQIGEHPLQFPIASESDRFKREVRQFVYRRTKASFATRLLFTVVETRSLVVIVDARHGTRRPITRREIKLILEELGRDS